MLFEAAVFNYYSISLFLGGIIAIASGAAVYFTNTSRKISFPWMLLNISTAVWSFGYFLMITSNEVSRGLAANWVLHIGAIFIPVLYFFFIISLTENYTKYKKAFFALFVPLIFFAITNPTTLFIKEVKPKYIFNYAPDAGILYSAFTIYFFSIVLWALLILSKKAFLSFGTDATRLKLVLLSSVFGFLGGGSVFFLTFNVQIPPYPILLFALYPIVIAYAIIQFRLFNTKIVTTEIFTFAIWIILLFQVFLAEDAARQTINLIILALTVILGIFLIRSVIKEVEQREEIERLAEGLRKANERLKELDKLKSQFLSIASHDLRAPLTAVRNFLSLLMDGTYGKIPPAADEGMQQVFDRATSMSEMVDNYLNVSRIEQGKMQYDFADIDFANILNEVISVFKPVAAEKGLTLTYNPEPNSSHLPMKADEAKLREVIENLVSNSINYTPEGSISVTAEKTGNTVRFTIKDTGIGMTEETKKNLFKLFNPGDDSRKYNPKSTGVGLYISKAHVEAHKGTIKAESEGKGKGSRFVVELPLGRV